MRKFLQLNYYLIS